MPVHNAMTGSELHETKGADAATKGHMLVANGVGAAVYQALMGNVVFVNQLSDLPTAAAGKITLLAGTTYLFGANVNIGTNYLLFAAGTGIQSHGVFTTTITYTGTVPMLQGADASTRIKEINLLCASSNLFSWVDGTPGTSIIIFSDVLVIACLEVGLFDDINTLVINGSTVVSCTSGITFEGTANQGTRLESFSMLSTSATYVGFDFTGATMKTLFMEGVVVTGGAGSIGIKGDAGSANITSGFVANVSAVQFQGVTTPLSGVTIDDIRWKFVGNGNIADSMPDALIAFTANATATVIATVNTPVLVAGTFTEARASQYATTAAGRITLLSERDVVTPIDVTLTIEPVSGTNKIITAYIALGGTVIALSGMGTHVDAGDPKVVTIPWQLNLSETNFIEVFVENNTDAVNLLVSHITFRVR